MNVGEIFNTALSSLTDPKGTANNLMKKKLTLMDGAMTVAVGALVPAVLAALAILAASAWIGAMFGIIPSMHVLMPTIGVAVGVVGAIATLIAVPITAIIAWLIESFIVWLVAGVLGGKGDFAKIATAWAFPMAAVIALSWIPLLNILVGLYALYVLYIFLQPIMKMDSNKALLTVLALIVIAILISWIMAVLAAASMPNPNAWGT